MAVKKMSLKYEFSKGLIRENPVLRLMLGACPTLAVTTSARNGLGMGIAATFVLLGSNLVISLLRPVIPEKVRIPAFITVIASFVTIVQMLMQAYSPDLNESLGIFIPLITVNCIILARAEMFASKHAVLPSLADGLGMGAGYTATLILMGSIREIMGNGSIMGINLPILGAGGVIEPMLIMILPPGGFFVYGILIAISQKLAARLAKKDAHSGLVSEDICAGAISDKTACLLCGACSLHKQFLQEDTAGAGQSSPKDRIKPQDDPDNEGGDLQ